MRRSAGPLGGVLLTGAFLVDMEAGAWKMVLKFVCLLLIGLFSSFCSFFLGLQIKQLKDGIFISQSKYMKDMLKKFGLENAKPIKTPFLTKGRSPLFH